MSILTDAALKYRNRLDAQNAADIKRLVDAYSGMVARLLDKQDLLLAELGTGEWSISEVRKMDRYKQLLAAITDELSKFNQYLGIELNRIGNEAISQSILDYKSLMTIATAGVVTQFNGLPADAIKTLLGFLDPDGPLFQRLQQLAPLIAEQIGQKILEGVGLGYNHFKVGQIISNTLGWGLTDSMRWARTTQMWTYREASRATMAANSNVIDGWTWFAILDDSVPPCGACLAEHGTFYPVDTQLDGHYNCRCQEIPHVKGDDAPFEQTGEDWFNSLEEAKQRDIMGNTKYNAFKEGYFDFSELSQKTPDNVFGTMTTETPLWKLLGAEPPLRTSGN